MRRLLTIVGLTAVILGDCLIFAQKPESELPAVIVLPEDSELTIGDSIRFQAVYVDTGGLETDTTAVWLVIPDSLGTIDATGLFIAELSGTGLISATLDSLAGWADVFINDTGDVEVPVPNSAYIILPSDTTVTLGAEIQFSAYHATQSGDPGERVVDSLAWTLEGMPVGDLSADGVLTTTATGFGLIRAQFDDYQGSAFLMVVDSTADTTGVNEITITRDSRNPRGYTVKKVLDEGGYWTIGGVHRVFNGGRIYFPIGSIPTDIRVHISIPEFAEDQGDSVRYKHKGMVGGVDFQVIVNDSLVEPYNFGTPLIVGLVFKRGLLRNLGIDPATLGLYFVTVNGDSVVLDSTGIGYTIVDLHRNRIYASIAHFSSLAIVGVENSTEGLGATSSDEHTPTVFALAQNYPNPFNPNTTIRFDLPVATEVQLAVYDLLGREVLRLVDQHLEAGYHQQVWNGRDRNGREVPTGIYFVRLVSGEFSVVRKMILMK